MKSIKLNFLVLLMMVLCAISASAYDFYVDGIYYRKNSDGVSVSVTSGVTGGASYSGSVVIPSNVNYNGISYTVTAIVPPAFYGSYNITSITIPSTMTSISGSFYNCYELETLVWNAKNCPKGDLPTSRIKHVTIGNEVQTLPDYFLEGSKIASVNIPNSVTSIGKFAFEYCTMLTSVSLPNSVSSIGYAAFWGCKELTSVNIPNSVTSIDRIAFKDCIGLKSITIPNSVVFIGASAFEGCSALETLNYNAISCSDFDPSAGPFKNLNIININIGNNVQIIPARFASGLTKLTSITIPNSVTSIGNSAFYGCIGLNYISMPNSLTSISNSMFYGCSGLKDLNIPNSITSIGTSAFYGCSGLISITIPNSIDYISNDAFNGCSGLTHVNIPNSVIRIGNSAFKGCTGLTMITMPNSLDYIDDDAFNGCSGLTHINIPNSVTRIGSSAFRDNTNLKNLIIPNSVTSIGSYAFYGCPDLSYVVVAKTTPPSGSNNMFKNGQLVYVPRTANYINNSYWKSYDLQSMYEINPHITRALVSSNENDYFWLKKAIIKDSNNQVFDSNDNSLLITDLTPNTNTSVIISFDIDQEEIEIDDIIRTQKLSFTQFSSILSTQTTLTPSFTINRDEGLILDACGVESSTDVYYGSIKETTNDGYIIESKITGLTPNCGYSFRPWVQYKGVKYYGDYSTFSTSAIEVNNNATITPTSIYATSNYSSSGDAIVTNAYFTFNGEKCESIYQTGLNPNSYYNYTYTIETTSGNQVTNDYFYTPSLSMVAQPARMLTNTTVMFEAQTNMIDEETMVGFEWRRYDAPDEMPSTKVYSPVFGGKIAGTLKNLAENVYYKYRPFYTSNSGKSYYGNWVAFLTADAGVVYEPIVYTYNSPAVTQTEATLQGVALRGSEDITEQGFEYWKSGNGNVTKVTATGERMSKKVSGLQSGSKYIFRAFLTAGGETHYGNEVEFVTLSNSLDVNIDGEINIADINAVIDMILTDNQGSSGDVNGDGEVNIADINTIIDAILSN